MVWTVILVAVGVIATVIIFFVGQPWYFACAGVIGTGVILVAGLRWAKASEARFWPLLIGAALAALAIVGDSLGIIAWLSSH
jgi:hypothetical protein